METIMNPPQEDKSNILTIIVAVVIAALSVVPFLANFKYNDNHLNWLNHDYGKNLMISTEQGTILMTEGGDNQVFGTLYFTYAEKLRPDITPYDQKGNIFKRIYGDMRYIDIGTLQRRQQLVDTGIFNGEEPFYRDIRDRADPYFIPYWQGQRPVYLTWQRPQPWTLGDYFYKRYGIMYKVMDIEYQLVDYLEIKQEITIDVAHRQFQEWLHKYLPIAYTMEKINKLEQEGYIRRVGNMVKFVKMYPAPHSGEYFDYFLLRWDEIPNAKYLDYLTREIIVNYDYQIGEIYREKIRELQEIRSRENRPEILADIDKRIQENWKEAKSHYEDAIIYGHDSISILHNCAVVYLNSDMEDLSQRAHELLSRGLELFPNSFGTYSVMFSYLVRDMLANPDKEAEDLKEIDKWFDVLKKQLSLYKGTERDYTKHPSWKNFEIIDKYMQQYRQVPTGKLNADIANLDKAIKQNPATVDFKLAKDVIELLYARSYLFQYRPMINQADKYFEVLIPAKKNDPQFNYWAFNITLQLGKINWAYVTGNNLIRSGNTMGLDYNFYYAMGKVALNMKKNQEAKIYFNKFLESIKADRMAFIQHKKQIDEIKSLLETL